MSLSSQNQSDSYEFSEIQDLLDNPPEVQLDEPQINSFKTIVLVETKMKQQIVRIEMVTMNTNFTLRSFNPISDIQEAKQELEFDLTKNNPKKDVYFGIGFKYNNAEQVLFLGFEILITPLENELKVVIQNCTVYYNKIQNIACGIIENLLKLSRLDEETRGDRQVIIINYKA